MIVKPVIVINSGISLVIRHCGVLRMSLLLTIGYLLTPLSILGQRVPKTMNPVFIRYGEAQGLPSENIYFAIEDLSHKIWFATDNGVSRFDGVTFENYSIDQGLADNEIFSIYQDHGGRIWFLSYSGIPSFFYKNQFFNSKNLRALSSINPGNFLSAIYEDKSSNIYLGSKNGLLYKIDAHSSESSIVWSSSNATIYFVSKNSKEELELYYEINSLLTIGKNCQDIFICGKDWFEFPPRVTKLKDGRIVAGNGNKLLYFAEDHLISYVDFEKIAPTSSILNIQEDGDGVIWVSTTDGVFAADSLFEKWSYFLEGISIRSAMKDHEGGLWFTSEDGVYYFANPSVLGSNFEPMVDRGAATALAIDSLDNIIIGYDNGQIALVSGDNLDDSKLFALPRVGNRESKINHILPLSNESFLVSSSMGSFRVTGDGIEQCSRLNSRRIVEYSNSGFGCICNSFGWDLIALDSCENWETSLHTSSDPKDRKRCSDVDFALNGDLWVANPNRLFRASKTKEDSFVLLNQWLEDVRIECIKVDPYGVLWVGTAGKGLLRVSSGKVQVLISEGMEGYSIVNAIHFVDLEGALIATSDGIVRIDHYQSESLKDLRYSWVGREDGLPSSRVNDVVLFNCNVWAATMEGVVTFDENLFYRTRMPPLIEIEHVFVDSKEIDFQSQIDLPYYRNSIGLSFVGISFHSLGDVDYRYRMNGLDTTWRYTKRNFVEYPELPSGSFCFEVQAKTKKAGWSQSVAKILIVIDSPFWRKAWFWISFPIVVLGLVIFVLIRRIRSVDRLNQIEKRALEAEQTLLRVQMNPHFIFNALNSIQRYFFSGDHESANDYLTDFGQLIRMMLEHSRKTTIRLEDEVAFIQKYIRIESLRLDNLLKSGISVQEGIAELDIEVPPMLLQPFLENAIWHGITPKGAGGILLVNFSLEGEYLRCVVEDNGVGRVHSKVSQREEEPTKHRSLAIQITNERLILLNRGRSDKASLKIEDLVDEDGNPRGTRVVVLIPSKL
jgi:ligand-binding sensor domain-containing protein